MTANRDLKNIIRQRQRKTGESYAAARAHVIKERDKLLGDSVDGGPATQQRARALVLKVNKQSARIQIFGEEGQVTFRSRDVYDAAPGQVVTLQIERRWTWRNAAYANGTIESAKTDIARLGLEPLPLSGGELDTIADHSEPYDDPDDPYTALWQRNAAKPRPSFEFDAIAWGALPGMDLDENPTCDAAELAEAGDYEGAREILMDVLCADLRCIDAHAHLGNLEFDHSPKRAMVHYEIGIQIGELSLPDDFDGLLVWGRLYNRPFLRCLHGYGLCLWRIGKTTDALRVFERILALNPNDNQGARFCWSEARDGRTWEEMQAQEETDRQALRQRMYH